MNATKTRWILVALLLGGSVAWVYSGKRLDRAGKLAYRPNVLCLKGSPFGRTIALAMRGPVDVYWHRGQVHLDEEDHEHGHHDGR